MGCSTVGQIGKTAFTAEFLTVANTMGRYVFLLTRSSNVGKISAIEKKILQNFCNIYKKIFQKCFWSSVKIVVLMGNFEVTFQTTLYSLLL